MTMNDDKAKQFLRRAHGDVGSLRCHENEDLRGKARRESDERWEDRSTSVLPDYHCVFLCVWENSVGVDNR
jgi:hypothetical protein